MKPNIQNVSLRISAGFPSQFPKNPVPQVAMSGRSNVGKSTLINTLLGRKSMARVSSSPGKTITINFYDVDGKMFLVDLPGYGYAKRTYEEKLKWSSLTDGYFTSNPNIDRLSLVIQLIDSRVGPTNDDIDMLRWLSETKTPHIIVATKTDKLNKTERNEMTEALKNHPDIAEDVKVIFFSAQTGEGKLEVWDAVFEACKF